MPSAAFEPRLVPDLPVWPQSVVTVVGNPKPGSRTAAAAASVAELLASELGTPYRIDELVDLVTFAPAIFQGDDAAEKDREALESAIELVSSASVIILATPVYKGSYTGLLKSFLDVLPHQALAGSVVVPVTVSAAASHKLLADLHLRPVLAELGASVPTPPVTLEEKDFEDLQLPVSAWLRKHAALIQATTIALQPVAEPIPAH
ncbi:NADPH-dependent FMN reductase [Kribbella sp. CA-293567]|uniref:NADPH-dependent FMN reductase n=1 Tax=Kribbella sp. CA-293567 TaxID=3002436 RepID=UPI0022DE7C9F|nr:NAD(P)H-dependent oxidoreductase [Kribbella sp. CA-293567]WBQ07166.1 NAD(P)H-dependent oxidoreductase [Kribbella sp. CA-293567]